MLRLNILLLLFVSFLSIEIFSQRTSEWEVLQSPTTDLLRKLFFVDSENGWATGLTGTIIHTSDAGKTWVTQNSNVATPIVDIHFINKNLGWALTYPDTPPFGTTLLKTTNGGIDWIKIDSLFQLKFMSCVYFADDQTGWIGGTGISKTTNGGLTWQECLIDSGAYSNYPVYDLNFFNKDFGYACGGRVDVAGVIWKTTNGGESWSSLGLSPDQIFDVFIFDSLNAITLSGDPELLFGVAKLTTSNAGTTWEYEELPIFGISFALDFLNNDEGYSASGFQLLHTVNGGINWEPEIVIDSLTIFDLQFVDEYTGFACGQDGTLLKFNKLTDVQDFKVTQLSFGLEQNYPNPFNSTTIIKYTVPSVISTEGRNLSITLAVYDVLGNEVARLVDEEQPAGNYEVPFDASNFASGIYFAQLNIESYNSSIKLVYIK